MVDGHPHRICEIEFYLNSPEHPDQYVHGHMDQTKNATWYFHRFNTGTYKAASFKGLDIVLGHSDTAGFDPMRFGRINGVYAAILIRSVIDIEQRLFIEGPCKTVEHILARSGFDSIMAFTGNNSLSILQNDRGLVLIEGNPDQIEPLKYGPRFGLNKTGPGYDEYKDKCYRYAVGPIKKNKTKLKFIL